MHAEAAGEEPVAVRHMHHARGMRARASERARANVRPDVDVLARVADDGRLAFRSARRVDADDVATWDCEQPVRIMIAEMRLEHERKTTQVIERVQIIRRHTRGLEGLAMECDILECPAGAPPHALELQLAEPRAWHRLDLSVPDHARPP